MLMLSTISTTYKYRFTLSFWLAGAVALLALIATLGGLLLPDLYRDSTWNMLQERGQDLVTLAIAIPLLVVSQLFAMRGSERGLLVWLGTLTYMLYTYLTYAFGSVFNAFFLLYIALVSLSLFTLIAALLHLNAEAIRQRFGEQTPIKTVSISLLIFALLIFMGWMKAILPALFTGQIPESILLARTPTNPVYVLDLGILLPAICLAAIWLWQRQAWGYVLCGILLVKVWTLTLAVISMSWFMYIFHQPGLDPVSVIIFLVFALASLSLTVIYLAHIHPMDKHPLRTAVP
jgi:hypothetical protein